jgi:bifunctional NMN adenylyltransferase/nudix hydrolase
MKSRTGIFIGRFQPVHHGHVHALGVAASQVEKLYILVGSANQCRSIKNPWTFSERANMIRAKMHANRIQNFEIIPLNDYRYSDTQWMSDVRATIEHYSMGSPILFGHMKDGNNYLRWFPELKFKDIESQYAINATAVRQEMFENADSDMPETVRGDYAFYQKEKQTFANYPFPETLNFNCSDAILECQGHILLIQRKFSPGRGAWALPGGFRNQRETFLDCAIRELIEETNVRVPEKVLRGSIVKTELFDDPSRSFGIPRNTMAVYMRISPNPDGSLPRANGADDAALCKWVPLTDALNNIEMYDDHKDIVSKVTGVMPIPAFAKIA